MTAAPVFRWQAVGRRKTSVARVYLTPGTGKWDINGRTLGDYFPRPSLVQHIQQSFTATDTLGAFDVRGPEPRPTALAKAARSYSRGLRYDHPVLDTPGWWRRPDRLYPWHGRCKDIGGGGRKLLITGATGTLGQAFARIAEHRGIPFCLTTRDDLDITRETSIAAAIARFRPWAIVNTAGFVRVADAENERDACFSANATGPEKLARACAEAGLPLVTFSSDLVFDGKLGRAYAEHDEVRPTGVYGLSKAEAEQHVLGIAETALVIRTSAFSGRGTNIISPG